MTDDHDAWMDDLLDATTSGVPTPQPAAARSAFLQRVHDLGLDALVLDEHDPRPGVLVSQSQLLAILNLLDEDALTSTGQAALLDEVVGRLRGLARDWDSRAVELADEGGDDPLADAEQATLAECAAAVFDAIAAAPEPDG